MRIESLDLDGVKYIDMLEQADVCQREGIKYTFHNVESDQGKYTVMLTDFSVGVCCGGDTTWYEDLDTIEPAVYRYEGIDMHSVDLDIFTDIAKTDIEYLAQVSVEVDKDKDVIVVRTFNDRDMCNEIRFQFYKWMKCLTVHAYAGKQHRCITEVEMRGAYYPKDILQWASDLVADIYI
jgi:hypothetical protein